MAEEQLSPQNVEIFPPEIRSNRLWCHGTRMKKTGDEIFKTGLNKGKSVGERTLAKSASFSADPRYSGGNGALMFFQCEQGDLNGTVTDGEWGEISANLDKLPAERGLFYIDGKHMMDFDKKIMGTARQALLRRTNFRDAGIADTVTFLAGVIEKEGVFRDEKLRTPDNCRYYAQAIVWNDLDPAVQTILSQVTSSLRILKDVKTQGLKPAYGKIPDHILDKDELSALAESSLRLPDLGGKIFDHPYYDITKLYAKEEIAELVDWATSLPDEDEKDAPQTVEGKPATPLWSLRTLKRILGK